MHKLFNILLFLVLPFWAVGQSYQLKPLVTDAKISMRGLAVVNKQVIWVSGTKGTIGKSIDGGKTWKKVYQSTRPYETTWKASFPTEKVGYVTIQSYHPDPTVKQQRVAKTVDGGATWTEINLVEEAGAREFGIGFINDLI